MVIERIKNEIKIAMKEKDALKKNTLKNVLDKANAAAKEVALKKKTEIADELTDEVCIGAINKEVKQLDQTMALLVDEKKKNEKAKEKALAEGVEWIEKADPTESELYKNTLRSKEILMEYLPKQLGEAELKEEITKLLEGMDISNKGKVMGKVMGALKGKADGKLINKVVDEIIKGQR